MKCVICKQGETQPGSTSVTLERGEALLIVKNVPAEICSNCGESYLSEETSREILKIGESALRTGVQLEVYSYKAA